MAEIPYKSAAQRRFMHAKKPEIAKKWDKKYGGEVKKEAAKRYLAKRGTY